MAAPLAPTNLFAQTGNGQNFLSWDQMAGATSYLVQFSLDKIAYQTLTTLTGSPLANYYLDVSQATGSKVTYAVTAINTSGSSPVSISDSVTSAPVGQVSLGWLRFMAKSRCDRVNSNFVTLPEWNSYISSSYKELYDILVQKFGDDYFVAAPFVIQTDGVNSFFALPSDFYKGLGVDMLLTQQSNTWLTLRKFQFINRNRGNQLIPFTYGARRPEYRYNGSNILFEPVPQAATMRVFYVPRPRTLLQDTDLLDGISGWEEYVIVDACIKALTKEESPVDVYMAQKVALIRRIEEAAENRDVGLPERVSDTAGMNNGWGFGSGEY